MDIFIKEPAAGTLTEEEKQSLKESLVAHMDKNPMRRVVADSQPSVPQPRSFHLITGAILVAACLLALAGFLLAR